MLAALHERGIEPDLLVGTSVGAVNAAYLAGPVGPSGTASGSSTMAAQRLEALARLWRDMRRHDVFPLDPRRWVGGGARRPAVDVPGDGLERLLQRHLGYDTLEEARIPVEVTATDLVTGKGLVLGTGPAVSAVRASAAVPGRAATRGPGRQDARRRRDRRHRRPGPRGGTRRDGHLPAARRLPVRRDPAEDRTRHRPERPQPAAAPPAHRPGPRVCRCGAAARRPPAVPAVRLAGRLHPDVGTHGPGP